MEIIQLTCVASWLAGFCLVYTGFTWYVSDEQLFFLNVFPRFWHDFINNNDRHLKEFKDVFTMILVIIKCLLDPEITYENKKCFD